MNQDCPTCREPMAWKYLKEPRCFKCNPEIKSELTPTTSTIKASNDMTDASRAELLPCPFCGSSPRETHHSNAFDGRKLLSIKCADRECHAGVLDYDEIATRKWNRRASVVIELPESIMCGIGHGLRKWEVEKAIRDAGCTVSVKQ